MYGKRLLTKEDRANAMNTQIEYLSGNGYTHTTYKELHILTKEDGNILAVKIFKDGAGKSLLDKRYTPISYGLQNVENAKTNYDSRVNYKNSLPKRQTQAAQCSGAIKKELTDKFKGVKFSVRSDNFAGGDSVHIEWTDGPTVAQVEEITSKYQYGHFDGMNDIYENTNRREDIPQAKYVQEHRTLSEETKESILTSLKDKYSIEYFNELSQYYQDRKVYEIFSTTSYHIEQTKAEVKTGTEQAEPTEAGSVQIVDYSEKAIAVIGETKAIKDELNALGGKFNFRLSCGAGWIFPKTKLQAVTDELQRIAAQRKATQPQPEEPQAETPTEPEFKPDYPELPNAHPLNILDKGSNQYNEALKEYIKEKAISDGHTIQPTPLDNKFDLEFIRIIWHEGYHRPNFDNATFTTWEDVQDAFFVLWAVNEKAQDGGYTKVKIELKLKGEESETTRIDITNKPFNGDFNPSLQHIADYLKYLCEDEPTPAPPLPATANFLQHGVLTLFSNAE